MNDLLPGGEGSEMICLTTKTLPGFCADEPKQAANECRNILHIAYPSRNIYDCECANEGSYNLHLSKWKYNCAAQKHDLIIPKANN